MLSPLLQGAFEDYQHALEHLGKGSPLDLKYSVLHAASSVELVLKEKLRTMGKSFFENKPPYHSLGFYDCVHKLRGVNVPDIPFFADLELLHQERNRVVHLGSKPDKDMAEWLLGQTGQFMSKFCQDQLGVDAKQYIKSRPVPSKPPEEAYLESARSALESQRYADALLFSSAATEYWLNNFYTFLTSKPTTELRSQSFGNLLSRFREDRLLDEDELARLRTLYSARNAIAHGVSMPDTTEAGEAVRTAEDVAAGIKNIMAQAKEAEEMVCRALTKDNVAFERPGLKRDLIVDIVIPNSQNPKFLVEIKMLRPKSYQRIRKGLLFSFVEMKRRYPGCTTVLITNRPDALAKEARGLIDAVFDLGELERFVEFVKSC